MKHLIISFKSRNELYSFARFIKSNNVFFSIINTPKSVGSSWVVWSGTFTTGDVSTYTHSNNTIQLWYKGCK